MVLGRFDSLYHSSQVDAADAALVDAADTPVSVRGSGLVTGLGLPDELLATSLLRGSAMLTEAKRQLDAQRRAGGADADAADYLELVAVNSVRRLGNWAAADEGYRALLVLHRVLLAGGLVDRAEARPVHDARAPGPRAGWAVVARLKRPFHGGAAVAERPLDGRGDAVAQRGPAAVG